MNLEDKNINNFVGNNNRRVNMKVIKKDGRESKFDIKQIDKQVYPACEGLDNVNPQAIIDSVKIMMTDGITTTDIQKSLILSARNKVDVDTSNYTYAAARLSLYQVYHNIKRMYGEQGSGDVYKKVDFWKYISNNTNLFSDWYKQYSITEFKESNLFVKSERDKLFDFLGFETYNNRYGMKNLDGELVELPQHLHLRTAYYLAQNEIDKMHWVKEFYDITSTLKYIHPTPMNSNGGKVNGGTISCLVTTLPDDLSGIMDTIKEIGMGNKIGAGWGVDATRLRAIGSDISTNKEASNGKKGFLKILNTLCVAIDQLGNRKGSINVATAVWDIEFISILDTKKANMDERFRCNDLFFSVVLDDVFMERVEADETFTMFDPKDAAILCETWGDEFRENYLRLEREFREDPSKFNKNTVVVNANDIMRVIVTKWFDDGMPWPFFKDNANRQNPYPELGIIRNSNLCHEVFQPTDDEHTAVCNLGSINLARCNEEEDLRRVVRIGLRAMDNSIDLTAYPSEKARRSQMERRSVGLGMLGEAEMLAQKGIHYGSKEHEELIDKIYGIVEDEIKKATRDLAVEKGSCIIEGVRNAYLMCTAPNVTSGSFAGTSNSHEAVFDKVWAEDNLLGTYLVTAPNININNYEFYKNAYELDQFRLLELTAVRQGHVDMGLSHNVYILPDGVKASYIKNIIIYAWKLNLKALYYLRSKAPKNIENKRVKENEIACVGCAN